MRYNPLEWHIGRTNMDTWWLTKPIWKMMNENHRHFNTRLIYVITRSVSSFRYQRAPPRPSDFRCELILGTLILGTTSHGGGKFGDSKKNTPSTRHILSLMVAKTQKKMQLLFSLSVSRWTMTFRRKRHRTWPDLKSWWIAATTQKKLELCVLYWITNTHVFFVENPLLCRWSSYYLPFVREFCHCPPPVPSSQHGQHGVTSELQLLNLCLSPLLWI